MKRSFPIHAVAFSGVQSSCGTGIAVGSVGGGAVVFVGQVAQHANPALHVPPATGQRVLE